MDPLDVLSRFTFDTQGEGALQLVAGGLAVMGVFTTVLLARSLWGRPAQGLCEPSRTVLTTIRARPLPLQDPSRYARDALADPVGAWEKGRVAGRKVRARTMDDVFDRMHEGGLGDPRVVQSAPTVKLVRLLDCRGCQANARADAALCHFERGFLEAAFTDMVETDARVVETRCRACGDPWCEFEVRYE